MKDLNNLTVAEFEGLMRKSLHWVAINREALAEIAEDLYAAVGHMKQVGWTQHKNFADPHHLNTSPCCAVGALHAMAHTRDGYNGAAGAVWMFEALTGENLVHFNDHVATEASQVTAYMLHVADTITGYLVASRD